jgi:hypothetical protein
MVTALLITLSAVMVTGKAVVRVMVTMTVIVTATAMVKATAMVTGWWYRPGGERR